MPRYWVGVQPFSFLKVRLKVETLEKPDCSAIWEMDSSGFISRASEDLIRRWHRYS